MTSRNRRRRPLVAAFLAKNPQFQSNPALAAQGIIDPATIDPVAKAYFAAGLIPTSPNGTLFPVAGSKNNYNEYDGKIDYNITNSDSLSGTFSNRDNPQVIPFAPLRTPTYSAFPRCTGTRLTSGRLCTPTLLLPIC